MFSDKIKKEMDSLISIAKKYRKGSISESMFYDVIYSLKPNDNKSLIACCKNYIADSGINLVSDEFDIDEDVDDANDSIYITPYNMTNIDISPKPLTLDLILGRLDPENDEIDLLPDFQRRAGLWTNIQKSQLIESLILRIPLPAFYFDASNNDKWIVIDGLQRLTALKEFFVTKQLELTGLEFLKDLEGVKVDDVPRVYMRRMLETQMTAYIINPGAAVNLKYNIFKRINTGGLKLENQEIRHALYQGYATMYVKRLVANDLFKQATGYSVKTDRMLDREFALRFIAFYEQKLSLYGGSIELFLNDAMDLINKKYDPQKNPGYANSIEEKFMSTLELIRSLFGQFAFRKMPDMQKRRPISKALFETWMVSLARLTLDECTKLKNNKDILLEKYMRMYDNDRDFIESLSSAKVYSVKKRFEKIEGLLGEVLNDK